MHSGPWELDTGLPHFVHSVLVPRLGVDLFGSMQQDADIANFYAELEAELEA